MSKFKSRIMTPPIYKIEHENNLSKSLPRWTEWHWIKMTELVAVANKIGKRNWTAESIGNTFRHTNGKGWFWFFIEGSESADSMEWSPEEKSEIPFENGELFVPSAWAKRVLCLIDLGVQKVVWSDEKLLAYFEKSVGDGVVDGTDVEDLLEQ